MERQKVKGQVAGPFFSLLILNGFDGRDFSKRLKGKKVVFVGDSLSLNNFQSLLCLLHAAVPSSNTTRNTDSYFTTVIFQVRPYSRTWIVWWLFGKA